MVVLIVQNYFTLLGLDARFDLSESVLNKAYIAAQQLAHPDRMVGKSEAQKLIAIQTSMDANEAYEALKNPLTRAQHLLALSGIKVNVDDADAVRPSQLLLAEMLELRESLSQAQTEEAIAKWAHDVRHEMESTISRLSVLFDADNLPLAADCCIRLRYLEKALEEAIMRQYRVQP